jgi:hypothetical protein
MKLHIIKTKDGYMVEHTEGAELGQYICDPAGNNLFDTQSEAEDLMNTHLMTFGTDTDNDMGTLEWTPLWDAMEANPTDWIPTTEKMYWQMLEAVPPRAHSNGAFLVGEASHSNAEGRTMYAGFKKTGGQFFAKYLTIDQFKTEIV